MQAPALHPTDGHQIVETFKETVADAIFCDSMDTRIMSDRYFRHGKPVHEREGGEKAVHPLKQLELLDDRATKHHEPAPSVMHAIVRDRITDEIADSRGEFPDEMVVSDGPPAAHDIVLREMR